MTLDELNLINSKGTAVVNKLYIAIDGARVQRYFIGVYGGRVKEIEDPNIDKELNKKIQNIQNLIDSGEIGGSVNTIIDNNVSVLANVNITKYDVVTSDGYIADSTVTVNRRKIVGISTETFLIGNYGNIQTIGEIQNTAWAFTVGFPVFLNGTTLSHTYPVIGFGQRIGYAIRVNTLDIDIGLSVLL